MINLKEEFYKRFVPAEFHRETVRILADRERVALNCAVERRKKLEGLAEENIKLFEDAQVKKERIAELAIANNDFMIECNQRFIALQIEKKAHKRTKIWFMAPLVILSVITMAIVGVAKGWW